MFSAKYSRVFRGIPFASHGTLLATELGLSMGSSGFKFLLVYVFFGKRFYIFVFEAVLLSKWRLNLLV